MKAMKLVHLVVIALVVVVAVSGCRKRPTNLTEIPGARTTRTSDLPPGGLVDNENTTGGNVNSTGTEGFPMPAAGSHEGWNEDAEAFKANTVLFGLDSSVVSKAEASKVAAVADQLKANAKAAVRVEGHCDERGTEEYNRALGERRALAVREALIGAGIDPTRVDTMSYGEDRPADPGQGEAAWKKNRRAEFILLTPP